MFLVVDSLLAKPIQRNFRKKTNNKNNVKRIMTHRNAHLSKHIKNELRETCFLAFLHLLLNLLHRLFWIHETWISCKRETIAHIRTVNMRNAKAWKRLAWINCGVIVYRFGSGKNDFVCSALICIILLTDQAFYSFQKDSLSFVVSKWLC